MAGKKTWTKEEEQYLKDNFKTMNFGEIARALDKTPGSVRAKASSLDLRRPPTNTWTEDEIEFMRKNARRMTIEKVAKKLGRTPKAVSIKAAHLKISFGYYTEEEINYIQEAAGTVTIDGIAKKLRRSKMAIKKKMEDLGCGNQHYEAGTYSCYSLGEIIGVAPETVKRWISHKGLPAVRRAKHRQSDKRYIAFHIIPEDFWKWAEEHKNIVEFNKIERNALLPEPDWVEEERKIQYHKPPRFKPWTKSQELQLMTYYYKDGLTQREIAEKMNRTLNSIERRLGILRKSGVKI